MSGSYRVGMKAPGEPIVWTLTAPEGVDLSTFAVIAITVLARFKRTGLPAVALTGWIISEVEADSLVATLLPTGSEFTTEGPVRFNITLTLDGVVYRYEPFEDKVEPWL